MTNINFKRSNAKPTETRDYATRTLGKLIRSPQQQSSPFADLGTFKKKPQQQPRLQAILICLDDWLLVCNDDTLSDF